jgi:hypothetical protein
LKGPQLGSGFTIESDSAMSRKRPFLLQLHNGASTNPYAGARMAIM